MEYSLIVELEALNHEEVSRFAIISSQLVRNIQTVNPQTCYTGKKIIVDIEGQLRPANICMISDDLNFIREQFNAIQVERTLEDNRRSSTSDASTSCQRSPDSIMPEPQHPQHRVPPMTFDQQTQTDKSLYDRLVPASAAQMSHQIEEIAQIQSQNNAILGSLSEVYRNQMIFNNNFTHCTNIQEEIMRKLRDIEESVEQLKQSEKLRTAPENSIYLQLTPDECSPSENLVIDTEAQPVEEAKPEVRTYKAPYKKNKICQLENEENVTPNVKRVKIAASPEASGESSTSQMVYRPEEDIVIGPNGTKIAAQVLKGINWACPSVATRKILVAVFSRNVLATHSLSGKPSPAFLDRNAKKQLDPLKIQDILHFVTKNANIPESNVRSVITAKCADENKMFKCNENGADPKNARRSSGNDMSFK
ncbi:uncharacterized protein LOC129807807 [Phlebotomus papatasi]|uniref:uncharacterized protein LOC129807807 n=1 Tax=Phlebotomus papatasi TaxID=29031 RepID=UPI0024836797|nr:uncharacterized protein LOC129807807 [Phlebotomus papatasi]